MNDLHEKLIKTLPKDILKLIVFLDEWQEPTKFVYLSKLDRMALMREYITKQVEPTSTNYWVWFGAYQTKSLMPTFYNDRVPRIIKEFLDGPLVRPDGKKQRLVNSFVEFRSDVNPFKFVPSCGTRIKSQLQYKNQTGQSVTETLAKQQQNDQKRNLELGLEILEENFGAHCTDRDFFKLLDESPHIQKQHIDIIVDTFKEKHNEFILRHYDTIGAVEVAQIYSKPDRHDLWVVLGDAWQQYRALSETKV